MAPLTRLAALAALTAALAACDSGPGDGNQGAGATGADACTGDPSVPIGGAFDLVDTSGAPVTQAALDGRYALLFFGFTHCPDVCPTELQRMTAALDRLAETGADLDRVQPVFVSVDPKRDTPDVIGDYLSLFHDRFLGLTGSAEQVAAAARAYRVYYAIDGDPAGDDYLINHAAMIYFMGPDGHYITHFTAEDGPDAIARRVGACL
ncbi:hypothetical protein CCR85_11580 [Rhodothalassium salexigens]|uniref:SCO family protein n=1 Tax=Rhodothalassium salexigens TaxID=1086 RepID=UPI0019113141|nr:SCO family protein [Rhodothalassium salexigens]MBK5912128.1 hypothetical protein [Rhodothalassium salexigens]MBK5921807.1 hypothetical protein [Rhodothalassium salexigens]